MQSSINIGCINLMNEAKLSSCHFSIVQNFKICPKRFAVTSLYKDELHTVYKVQVYHLELFTILLWYSKLLRNALYDINCLLEKAWCKAEDTSIFLIYFLKKIIFLQNIDHYYYFDFIYYLFRKIYPYKISSGKLFRFTTLSDHALIHHVHWLLCRLLLFIEYKYCLGLGDFLDTYRNLSYKNVFGKLWVSNFCEQADFVVKTDDDMFVDLYATYFFTRHEYMYLINIYRLSLRILAVHLLLSKLLQLDR